jgi:hypothetical protein
MSGGASLLALSVKSWDLPAIRQRTFAIVAVIGSWRRKSL